MRLDLLRPNTADRVEKMQSKQKKNHDNTKKLRRFHVDALVYVRNTLSTDKWVPGTVVKAIGNVSYSVRLEVDGRIRKCHIDQLRPREERPQVVLPYLTCPNIEIPSPQLAMPTPEVEEETEESSLEPSVTAPDPISNRKSTLRTNRRPVDRYDPSFK